MTEVTRSMQAGEAGEAATVERRRLSLPGGLWGMALVVATETALFGSLIASYFYLRLDAGAWPPPGVPKPSVVMPLVLTGVLVGSVVPAYAAARAGARGRARAAWLGVALAAVVQGVYLGLQIHLFVHDLHDFRPSDNAYGSIYFTLLAVHHAHVALGLALDAWLLGKLAGGLTSYRVVALRAVALYWAFVAGVGVAVVFTVLFPSL